MRAAIDVVAVTSSSIFAGCYQLLLSLTIHEKKFSLVDRLAATLTYQVFFLQPGRSTRVRAATGTTTPACSRAIHCHTASTSWSLARPQ